MALVSCPECGKHVSTQATACPHCGCPSGAVATGIPVPHAATSAEDLEIKISEAGGCLLQGKLHLDDRSLAPLGALVDLCRTEFMAGRITGINICGHDWRNEHMAQLVQLLLPESGKYSTGIFAGTQREQKHLEYADKMIPALTELEIVMCEKLTKDWGVEVGARLWSLKKVNLFCWTTSGDSWHAIMQLIRLPKLEQISLPIGLQSSCGSFPLKERDILMPFYQQHKAQVTVS